MRRRWTSDNRVVTIIERVSPNLHKITVDVWEIEWTAYPGGTPIPTRLVAQYEAFGSWDEMIEIERRMLSPHRIEWPRGLIQTYREL